MKRIMTNRRVVIAVVILSLLSVWTVQSAVAETPEEQSIQKIINQWQAIFPDQPYVCWRKHLPGKT